MSSKVGKKCFKLWCVLCAVQNCNFRKAQDKLPEDGPDGPKHVGAIMRYFNCTF
jgi:hypothetical protein